MKMEKSTEELFNAIKEAKTVTEYLTTYEDELVDFTLPEYFARLLEEKSLDKATVVRNSGLNQVYGYQILSGNRKPGRDKLLALAFGFELNAEETQKLLKYAEQPQLYARNQRDSIILFALERRLSIYVCNELLEEANAVLLINAE